MELYKIPQEKTESCVKEVYKIDSGLDIKNAHFKEIEAGIKQLIAENVKKHLRTPILYQKWLRYF